MLVQYWTSLEDEPEATHVVHVVDGGIFNVKALTESLRYLRSAGLYTNAGTPFRTIGNGDASSELVRLAREEAGAGAAKAEADARARRARPAKGAMADTDGKVEK